MRRTIITLAALFAVAIPGTASADTVSKCCSDGKPPTKAVQKAACKGTSGETFKACTELATLPDWWMATDGGVNTHVVSGVTLIKNLRKVQPYWTLKQEFKNNIKAYRDQHVTVGPITGPVN